MATTSTTSTTTSAADIFAAINGSSTKSKTGTTSSDISDRFLTLLTTQLKNQDPMNPSDSNQMISQLSQINMVTGLEKLNTAVSNLLGAYNDTQSMQSAALIGKNVLANGNILPLSSSEAYGAVQLAGAADKVTIKIQNSAGTTVATKVLENQSAGNITFGWDGKDTNGNALTDGNYKFTVEATKNGAAVTATAMQVGTVNAVTRSTNGFVLDLGALGSVDFDSVQQIF